MSRKKKQLRFHSVVLVIILAAGLSLRLYRLDYQSLWYDEIKNISLAKEFSLKEFSSGEHASTQPVFLLFILRPWIKVFGMSEYSARFPAVILGVVSLLLTYGIGLVTFGRTVGLLSAYLLAISPLGIYYSQQAGYSCVLIPIILLSMFLFLRMLKYGCGVVWLNIANTALIYIHPVCFIAVIVQNIAILLFVRNKGLLRKWFSLQLFTFLGVLIWWYIFIRISSTGHDGSYWMCWVNPPTFKTILATLESFSHGVYQFAQGGTGFIVESKYLFLPRIILLFYVFFFIYGLVKIRTENRYLRISSSIVILWLIIPVILLFIFSRLAVPIYITRYLIYCVPAYYLLVAYGISKIKKASIRMCLVGLISLLHFFPLRILYEPSLTQVKNIESWREIAMKLRDDIEPEDIVILSPLMQIVPFWYYYRENEESTDKVINIMGRETNERWDMVHNDGLNLFLGPGIGETTNFIRKHGDTIASAERIWLIVSPQWPGQNGSGELLIDFFRKSYILEIAAEYPFPGVKVFLFENKSA